MANTISLVGIVALMAFNLPVAAVLVALPLIADLRQALKEKAPSSAADTTSYSRVTGFVGAAIVTSFYWAIGNVVLVDAVNQPADIKAVLGNVLPFFLVGSALFVPYAFNQLKNIGGGAAAIAAAQAPAPPPPAAQAAPVQVTIANTSQSIDDQTFAAKVAAISVQVSRDFQPEWGVAAVLTPTRLSLGGGTAPVGSSADAVIYVGDSTIDPARAAAGIYSYHAATYGAGTAYGFVYLDVCKQLNRDWSAALSHEVLELLADPLLTWSATGPAPVGSPDDGQMVSYEYEVCDPTEGDTYCINGVTVSNFVTRAYFDVNAGTAATNFLRRPLAPFGIRPGGYVQYEIDSIKVTFPPAGPAQAAARALMGRWRRNARRAAVHAQTVAQRSVQKP
jgi:hypothetical protein